MSKNTLSDKHFISSYIPHKSSQDELLCTVSFSMIVSSIVLIGIAPSLSQAVRFSLSVSIGSLTISLFLLLWYNPRLEIRNKRMKHFLEKRVEKIKEDMRNFVRTYEAPLYGQVLIDNFRKLSKKSETKSEDDFRRITEMAIDKLKSEPYPISDKNNIALKLFTKDFFTDLYFMNEKIYHKPLKEDYGKLKYYLDIISYKLRYHFFVIGVVSLAFSIITHLLLK